MSNARFEELSVGAQFYALDDVEQIVYTKIDEQRVIGMKTENAECETHTTYFKPTELVVPVGMEGM